MNLSKNVNGANAVISIEGRLDTVTAPELEKYIGEIIDGISELVLDFAKLEYISSAGLRVLLATEKTMAKQGKMVIKNVNDTINEIFEITGFSSVLTIE